ncbi:MAG: ABC transporter substrate-binding protein [Sphingomonas sp.]
MRVLMTIAEGHYPVLARRSAGIASLADLKGKRILGYRHTTAGYFLHKMLKTVGLTFDDVTIVETPLGKVGQRGRQPRGRCRGDLGARQRAGAARAAGDRRGCGDLQRQRHLSRALQSLHDRRRARRSAEAARGRPADASDHRRGRRDQPRSRRRRRGPGAGRQVGRPLHGRGSRAVLAQRRLRRVGRRAAARRVRRGGDLARRGGEATAPLARRSSPR